MTPLDEVLGAFQVDTEHLATTTAAEVLAVYRRMVDREIGLNDAVLLIAGLLNRASASAVSLADLYLATQLEAASGAPAVTAGVPPVDHSDRLVTAVHKVLTAAPKTKLSRAEVRHLIASSKVLDPDHYDVAAITARVNESLRDTHLPDPDDPDYLPEHGAYLFDDFIEQVVEHPKKLSEIGLFPPPPPHTEAYEQWGRDRDAAFPEIDSDDFDHFPPIWEPEPEHAEMRLERLARSEVFEAAQDITVEIIDKVPRAEGWVRQLDADPCQLCRWWWRDGYVWPSTKKFQRHANCNCQPRVVLAEQKSDHTKENAA